MHTGLFFPTKYEPRREILVCDIANDVGDSATEAGQIFIVVVLSRFFFRNVVYPDDLLICALL